VEAVWYQKSFVARARKANKYSIRSLTIVQNGNLSDRPFLGMLAECGGG